MTEKDWIIKYVESSIDVLNEVKNFHDTRRAFDDSDLEHIKKLFDMSVASIRDAITKIMMLGHDLIHLIRRFELSFCLRKAVESIKNYHINDTVVTIDVIIEYVNNVLSFIKEDIQNF